MGRKDIVEKNLEAWNDVFADIVNVLLFNGNRLVEEKDLESDSKDTMLKIGGKLHEQERDVSKFWKNGEIRISLLGFENQTRQDYNMPLRIISYDGASYKQQILNKELRQKYPVVTLVLYFGTESRWTAPKNLKACFEIPENLRPFVSDYKINVFDVAWLPNQTISKFNSDFKFIAKYFQTKRLNTNYCPTKEEIVHVDELMKTFTVLTGDKSFERAYNEVSLTNKGGITMCEVVEKIRTEGRAEGREDIIRRMLETNFATEEQIANLLKISVKDVKKIAAKVPVMSDED